MDRLFHILFVLRRPEVKILGHEIVDSARGAAIPEVIDFEQLHRAIDDPALFLDRDAGWDLRQQLERLGETVLSGNRNLKDRVDALASQLARFSSDAASFGRKRFARQIPPPSEFELASDFYRDVAAGADKVAGYVEVLRRAVSRTFLREFLDETARELAEIKVSGSPAASRGRLRLWEIESTLAVAFSLLHMPFDGFRKEARAILKRMEIAKPQLSDEETGILDPLGDAIVDALHSRESNEDDLRELVIEAYFLLSRMGSLDGGSDRPPAAAEKQGLLRRIMGQAASERPEAKSVPGQPSLEDVADIDGALIATSQTSLAVAAVNALGLNASFAGAGLLLASYRHRLGTESPLLRTLFTPMLRRALLGEARGESSPGGWTEGPGSLVVEKLLQPIRFGLPIVLEFGGGRQPYGVQLAAEFGEAAVLSIDPKASDDPKVLQAMRAPENFLWVRGWAEEAAALAAHGPFARSVAMVSPGTALLRMLLSAILVVRPDDPPDARSGFIDIYGLRPSERALLEPFRQAGFDIQDVGRSPGHPSIPASIASEHRNWVNLVRLRAMHDLLPAPDQSGRLGGGPVKAGKRDVSRNPAATPGVSAMEGGEVLAMEEAAAFEAADGVAAGAPLVPGTLSLCTNLVSSLRFAVR